MARRARLLIALVLGAEPVLIRDSVATLDCGPAFNLEALRDESAQQCPAPFHEPRHSIAVYGMSLGALILIAGLHRARPRGRV